MTIQKSTTFLTLALAVASLGFSQDNTKSTATSANTINATVFASGGGQAQAIAGVAGTPGVFSGFPETNEKIVQYWNPLYQKNSISEIAASRGKHDKVKFVPRMPAIAANEDPVWMLNWSPFGTPHYKDGEVTDKVIGVITVVGKADEPLEAALAAGLWEAKEKTHTRRVVVFLRNLNVGVTKGFSIGTGQAAGMIMSPGSNNPSVALATGGLLGKNTTRQENIPEFRIVCLNDGPLTPPEPASTKIDVPPPPPQSETKAPPVQTVRIEVITMPPTPSASASAPAQPLQPSAPPVTTTAPIANCDIPSLTIYFEFNGPKVDPKYQDNIRAMADWLKGHQACKVQIQGHASKEASRDYNVKLGQSRWDAVYNLLLAAGASKDNLEGASLGKDFPRGDYETQNRRVILVVQGNASGR
jgi:outer membrane protein OmpA-like peptidoglycan-associated protein